MQPRAVSSPTLTVAVSAHPASQHCSESYLDMLHDALAHGPKMRIDLAWGPPKIKLQTAFLAIFMFAKDPRIWIFSSARTIRVRVAFSIAYFVFPSFPASRPIA